MTQRGWMVAAAAVLLPLGARAVPITWQIEGVGGGTWDEDSGCVSQICKDLVEGFARNDFTARVTFDPDAEGDGSYVFSGAPYGLTLDIGGYHWEVDGVRFAISVSDSIDSYVISASDTAGPIKEFRFWNCWWEFEEVITSTALLATPPPLSQRCPDGPFVRIEDAGIGTGRRHPISNQVVCRLRAVRSSGAFDGAVDPGGRRSACGPTSP